MSKNRVKAFVRFRPTDNFDHDSIELLDDNQVSRNFSLITELFIIISNTVLNHFVRRVLHEISRVSIFTSYSQSSRAEY